MKNTHLRLGNILKDTFKEQNGFPNPYFEVSSIFDTSDTSVKGRYLVDKHSGPSVVIEYFSPIELTDEWIKKIDTYTLSTITKEILNSLVIPKTHSEYQKYYAFLYNIKNNVQLKKITYVHDLQNFIFEMTQQEITFNL